jgi:phosphoribosylformylglycinamidine cyclo-ligase
VIDLDSWQWPPVFAWLQRQGGIATGEMLRTFNCGLGMLACVPVGSVGEALAALDGDGIRARVIGRIESDDGAVPAVHYTGQPRS